MKIKLIIILIFMFISNVSANPIIKMGIKKIIKESPKIIKVVVPLISTITEINADEIRTKPMSKKKLDLYKTNFKGK